MTEAKMTYEVTARFDDGLYDIDENNNWRLIGPPLPPCRCLYCTSARLALLAPGAVVTEFLEEWGSAET